jgi:hypothetical protein
MAIWRSFIAKQAMQFGDHALPYTHWQFGYVLSLNKCWRFGNTKLLSVRWQFGNNLLLNIHLHFWQPLIA